MKMTLSKQQLIAYSKKWAKQFAKKHKKETKEQFSKWLNK